MSTSTLAAASAYKISKMKWQYFPSVGIKAPNPQWDMSHYDLVLDLAKMYDGRSRATVAAATATATRTTTTTCRLMLLLLLLCVNQSMSMSLDRLALERNELPAELEPAPTAAASSSPSVLVDDMKMAAVPAQGNTDMYMLVPESIASQLIDTDHVHHNTIEEDADADVLPEHADMLMLESDDTPAMQLVELPSDIQLTELETEAQVQPQNELSVEAEPEAAEEHIEEHVVEQPEQHAVEQPMEQLAEQPQSQSQEAQLENAEIVLETVTEAAQIVAQEPEQEQVQVEKEMTPELPVEATAEKLTAEEPAEATADLESETVIEKEEEPIQMQSELEVAPEAQAKPVEEQQAAAVAVEQIAEEVPKSEINEEEQPALDTTEPAVIQSMTDGFEAGLTAAMDELLPEQLNMSEAQPQADELEELPMQQQEDAAAATEAEMQASEAQTELVLPEMEVQTATEQLLQADVNQAETAEDNQAAAKPQTEVEVASETEIQKVAEMQPEAEIQIETEAVAQPEAEVQPEVEAEIQPAADAEIQIAVEAEIQPAVDADIQPAVEGQIQPAVEAVIQPAAETEIQPEAEAEIQPEAEAEIQLEAEAQIQPEAEAVIQPAVEAEIQPAAEAEIQPIVEAAIQPIVEAEIQPAAEAEIQPAVDAEIQPIVEAEIQPAAEAEIQPIVEAEIQPAADAEMQPAAEAEAVDQEPLNDAEIQPIAVPVETIKTEPELQKEAEKEQETAEQETQKLPEMMMILSDEMPDAEPELEPAKQSLLTTIIPVPVAPQSMQHFKPEQVMDSVLNYVNASFMLQQPAEELSETTMPETSFNAQLRRYDGAQLWRIVVQTDKDKKLADELQSKYDGQLWKEVKQEVDYLLKPQVLAAAERHIRAANLSRIVLIDNLQQVIEVENPPADKIAELQNRKGHRLTWQAYHRLEDIHGFIDYMAKTYPDICSTETIGYSVEKRPLKILKISNGNARNPGIWIDGGMHAREWISPATVTYMANQLVEGWEDLPEHMRNINWYIHPVANPDGYEYSHTTDRLWRKNMRAHGRQCPGVDLNRNFGYKWGGKGTSASPCSQTYRGSKAFSEPETFYISKFISGFPRETFQAYLSFHSYGQYILYPWGYDYHLTKDRADLDRVARQAGTIITKSSGVKYTVGSSATTLYPAAGGSDDWAKGIAGIKYAYTIEMGDTGRYGFVLPAQFIQYNGKDGYTFADTVARAITQGRGSKDGRSSSSRRRTR